MSRAASGLPSRREVLVGGSLLALAGCLPGGDDEDGPPVDPEARVRARIAAEVRALGSHYDGVIARFPEAEPRLAPLAAEHEAHARALLGPPRARPSASGSPSATPSASPPVVPETLVEALAGLVSAERAASRRRAGQAGRASPGLARLLASVGGCEAAHAALLSAGPA
jgi:hypothetical protein